MRKLPVVAVLALLMTAAAGVTAIGSGGANTTGELASTRGTDFLPMRPGKAWIGYGILDGPITAGQMDLFILYNMSHGGGELEVEIVDCCAPGDTMFGLVLGTFTSPLMESATSPESIFMEAHMPGRSLGLVIAGYQSASGYPAGYFWSFGLVPPPLRQD